MTRNVSIIVPVYNVEKYLKECIQSILEQTYKNIEIILIDDGSTDNSYEICKECMSQDNRIKLIHKENGGLSDARNYGIKNAIGDYLVFVDSDDIISKDFIKDMVNAIESEEADIACCRYNRFKTKAEIDNINTSLVEKKKIQSRQFLKLVFYQHDQTLYSVSFANKIYRRNLFQEVKFPIGKLYEDVAIIGNVLERCNKIALVDKIMYFYRISDNSITNSKFDIRKLDIINHLKKYLTDYRDDKEIQIAVKNMLFARAFELLTIMQLSKYDNKEVKKELCDIIKENRKLIIKDKNSRKIAKFSAILSYLSMDFSIFLNCLYKKIKNKCRIQ